MAAKLLLAVQCLFLTNVAALELDDCDGSVLLLQTSASRVEAGNDYAMVPSLDEGTRNFPLPVVRYGRGGVHSLVEFEKHVHAMPSATPSLDASKATASAGTIDSTVTTTLESQQAEQPAEGVKPHERPQQTTQIVESNQEGNRPANQPICTAWCGEHAFSWSVKCLWARGACGACQDCLVLEHILGEQATSLNGSQKEPDGPVEEPKPVETGDKLSSSSSDESSRHPVKMSFPPEYVKPDSMPSLHWPLVSSKNRDSMGSQNQTNGTVAADAPEVRQLKRRKMVFGIGPQVSVRSSVMEQFGKSSGSTQQPSGKRPSEIGKRDQENHQNEAPSEESIEASVDQDRSESLIGRNGIVKRRASPIF